MSSRHLVLYVGVLSCLVSQSGIENVHWLTGKGEEPPLREYSRVEFWPFTGPLAKLGKGRWDEMEGCIAITAMDPGQVGAGSYVS